MKSTICANSSAGLHDAPASAQKLQDAETDTLQGLSIFKVSSAVLDTRRVIARVTQNAPKALAGEMGEKRSYVGLMPTHDSGINDEYPRMDYF